MLRRPPPSQQTAQGFILPDRNDLSEVKRIIVPGVLISYLWISYARRLLVVKVRFRPTCSPVSTSVLYFNQTRTLVHTRYSHLMCVPTQSHFRLTPLFCTRERTSNWPRFVVVNEPVKVPVGKVDVAQSSITGDTLATLTAVPLNNSCVISSGEFVFCKICQVKSARLKQRTLKLCDMQPEGAIPPQSSLLVNNILS